MIWWVLTSAALAVAVVGAFVALEPRRRWWSAIGALPVASAIVLGIAGVGLPAAPASTIALGVGFLALGTVGGNGVTTVGLRLAIRSTRPGTHGGILVAGIDDQLPMREILRGGTTIGYLERFAFMGSVLLGQAPAIAVIVAIKGLARFSELENAAARERFIIGTLCSLAWAGSCSAAVLLAG